MPPSRFAAESPAEILRIAQIAPNYLERHSTLRSIPVAWSTPTGESPDTWKTYEQLMAACLQTGDDKSAHLCLERLVGRFGASNERVLGLSGVYHEAVSEDKKDLERIIDDYEGTLSKEPSNASIAKRRITLLRSLGKPGDAIKALNQLLDVSPVDLEAWAELSEIYFDAALYAQALFCLEEVLLIAPNAWNVHARIGEILYISSALADSSTGNSRLLSLTVAFKRFCRSVEICEAYIRGWCGVKLASDRLIQDFSTNGDELAQTGGVSVDDLVKLNQRAKDELLGAIALDRTDSSGATIAAARRSMK